MVIDGDLELGLRYPFATPGYRHYPRPQFFRALGPREHQEAARLSNLATPVAPLQLYVQAPQHDRRGHGAQRSAPYLQALLHEIRLQALLFDRRRPLDALHFNRHAATFFDDEQIGRIIEELRGSFAWAADPQLEMSIELSMPLPDRQRIARLFALGLRRVGLRLLYAEPADTGDFEGLLSAGWALGLSSVTLDLVLGEAPRVPAQAARRLDELIACGPDRVRVHRKPMVEPATLRPDRHGDLVRQLNAAGYVHLGLDHFVTPDDELAQALARNRLHLGLQGHADRALTDVIGLGPGGISQINGVLSQNSIDGAEYHAALASGALAVTRGLVMTRADQLRAAVIDRVLCGREVSYGQFRARFDIDFREHFRASLLRLNAAERDGLVERRPDALTITARGRHFLPAIAQVFDAYTAIPPASAEVPAQGVDEP